MTDEGNPRRAPRVTLTIKINQLNGEEAGEPTGEGTGKPTGEAVGELI